MTWPQPNAHGVYMQPTERLALPNPRKGWRGSPLANIDLLLLEDGWRVVTGSNLSNGSGHGCGLSKRERPHPTREAAILAAVRALRFRMEMEVKAHFGPAEAPAVLRWLDEIEGSLVQPHLFAGLAA